MQKELNEQILNNKSKVGKEKDSLDKLMKEQVGYAWITHEHFNSSLTSDVNYEKAKAEYLAIKEIYDEKNIELKGLEEQQKECNNMIRRYQEIIEDNDININWLENNYRVVELNEIKTIKEKEKNLEIQHDQLKEKVDEIKQQHDQTEGAMINSIKTIKDRFSYNDPYPYQNEMEHDYFKLEKAKVEVQLIDLNKQETQLRNLQYEYTQTFSLLDMEYPEITLGVFEPLQDFILEAKEIKSYTKKVISELKKYVQEEIVAKNHVQKSFSTFKNLLEETDNPKIKKLARQFDVLLAEERLYDSDFVLTKFAQVLQASDEYKKRVEQLQLEVEKDRKQLIDMAIKRLEAIYDRIIEMPKSSRMNLYGEDIQAIRLRWDRLEEVRVQEQLSGHIQMIIEAIHRMTSEVQSEEEIQRFIQTQLGVKELMNYFAPFHHCRIQIFKPKKEQVLLNKNIELQDWEVAVKWSGGEQYTVYMTMFMVYIMHIRQTITGREKEPFTIIVDNPFGKASNDHIVDPILEIAHKNNIQLICLTAHDTPRIIAKFPVVYSNVYNYEPNSKIEIMRSELKETLESMKYINDDEYFEQLNLV